jgi:hypothetical protein
MMNDAALAHDLWCSGAARGAAYLRTARCAAMQRAALGGGRVHAVAVVY